MVVSSVGLRPKSDCSGKAQKQLYSKLQTRPLVREDASHKETQNRQTENKNLDMGSRWAPDCLCGCATDTRLDGNCLGHFVYSLIFFNTKLIRGTQTGTVAQLVEQPSKLISFQLHTN
jgi:hypothetical protein